MEAKICAGCRSMDEGSEAPPPVWHPLQTLNALVFSCVSVGAGGGAVVAKSTWPRIAPCTCAGVATLTYHLLALKLSTSAAVIAAGSVAQWIGLTASWVSWTSS